MSMSEAEAKYQIVGADVVPVHVASILRQLQAAYEPPRGIALTLEVDETLYASADPDMLFSALRVLLQASCAGQPDFANISVNCDTADEAVCIEADGEDGLPRGPTVRGEYPSSFELTLAQLTISSMGGGLDLSHDARSSRLFRLLLPHARPSRISSRPVSAR